MKFGYSSHSAWRRLKSNSRFPSIDDTPSNNLGVKIQGEDSDVFFGLDINSDFDTIRSLLTKTKEVTDTRSIKRYQNKAFPK